MPKNPLRNLARRRSSGNALDIQPESPPPSTESSFRVLERPQKTQSYYGGSGQQGALSQGRPSPSFRGSSTDNLAVGVANRLVAAQSSREGSPVLKQYRGSGGTTNSGSSGYYDSSSASARYSSTSTLPSSLDQETEEDLFPRKPAAVTMQHSQNSLGDSAPLPPPPSFSSRASRALSFGLKSKNTRDLVMSRASADPPSPPVPRMVQRSPERQTSPPRERAMTTSSYASTARPPQKLDLSTTDFGNDFGVNMFEEPARTEEPAPPLPPFGGFHRTESEPMFPPRSYSRQTSTPSPLPLAKHTLQDPGSPYSQDKRNSHDGLMGSTSALNSPNMLDGAPPPPQHASSGVSTFLGGSKPGYDLVPARSASPAAPERLSEDSQSGLMNDQEPAYTNRQSQLDDGDRWVKRVQLQDPQEPHTGYPSAKAQGKQPVKSNSNGARRPQAQAVAGASRAGAVSPGGSEADSDLFGTEHSTPKAAKLQPQSTADHSWNDVSPSGPPSRAIRPGSQLRTESGTPKKMTKAQFEARRRDKDPDYRQEEVAEEDDVDDDDDEERVKKIAAQRKKQEATMSVYRQQMKKIAGGQLADLPPTRPGLERHSNSVPLAGGMSGLHLGGFGQEPALNGWKNRQSDDEDDEVPLGILQAHGFPNGSRPPMANGTGAPPSVAGSVMGGGGGNLPAFARRLPQDPYYGASLVNQSNRENLAGTGSVYGASAPPPPGLNMGHPGGLVGVIAGEERAKAARRATPSASYGTPLPANMPQQMPQMPRTMSMGNVPPQAYSPSGMPPMPGMMQMPMQMPPQDQTQAQMQQLMQMQMQFMQNMMAMQNGQMPQTPGQMPGMSNFLAPPQQQQQQQQPHFLNASNRPVSFASQAPSQAQGRAMTMMAPPTQWGGGNSLKPQQQQQQQQRPVSALPAGYAASGLNIPAGPGAGYTPSIAPSERSNVGMPSRYRPVATNGDEAAARSQSMTSSMTLQAFTNKNGGAGVQQELQPQASRNTIRLVDKPKGAPRSPGLQQQDEELEEDGGWADLKKKREGRKFKWGRREKKELGELYSGGYE